MKQKYITLKKLNSKFYNHKSIYLYLGIYYSKFIERFSIQVGSFFNVLVKIEIFHSSYKTN